MSKRSTNDDFVRGVGDAWRTLMKNSSRYPTLEELAEQMGMSDTDLERELVQQAQRGNEEARKVVVLAHGGLVRQVAKSFGGSTREEFEDLLQEGWIALIESIDRFDPNAGARLATFAYHRIEGRMRTYLAKRSGFRISRQLRENMQKVAKAREELEQDLSQTPTMEEIANRTGLSIEKVNEAITCLEMEVVSLDELMEGDETGEVHWEPPASGLSPEKVAAIHEALDRLPEEECKIVMMHAYGGYTFREIAESLGISKTRAIEKYDQALYNLQRMLSD